MRISDWSSDVCSSDLTDSASTTNSPPTRTRTSSCCAVTAIVASAPPSARLPVSPMKTAAGGALNHRKARQAPMIAAANTASSPAPGTCRSEEHTSELQSLMRITYAVFCLTKKKNHTILILQHNKTHNNNE